ncbi:MAG: hypothetical protein HWD60_10220 [Defluviicoccus sp.]|nr:MAG: hypothetical protein HWD60_10220 [Defluviicoccus sp.]
MDRDVLKLFLRAGPARRFDVCYFTQRLLKAGESESFLFTTPFLNNAILFKCVDFSPDKHREEHQTVGTLVYMPYDSSKAGDGGEAFFFTEANFLRYYEYKASSIETMSSELEADCHKLRILDSIPTFSPFVIEQAFQRAETSFPDSYLQLTPDVRARVTAHLKGRLRPLIVAAYKHSTKNVERAVEDLTSKLFCLSDDLRDVLPLITALRLPPELAKEVLTSWLGIAYFEYEYSFLQPKLKEFAGWIGKYSQPVEVLGRREHEFLVSQVNAIKQRIRSDWNDTVSISHGYRASYESMVYQGDLEPFVKFLKNAETFYWRMGEVLGRLEQTVAVWRHFVRHYPERRLPFALLSELLDVLRSIHSTQDILGATGSESYH